MKTIFALIVSFLFGAFMGTAAGFDPIATGSITTFAGIAAGSLGLMPTGVLSATIDLSLVNSQLNAYIKHNLPFIWSKVRQGLELDQFARMVPNVQGKHASISSSQSEILQAFQSQWTPKGGTTFTPLLNESFHIKADYPIDNIDVLWGTYLEWLTDDQTRRDQWPFVRWVIETQIIPKLIEEINTGGCTGSYVAPTPGTPGTVANMMNGILTQVSDMITATTISPIVTGAITSANGVSKVETFVKSLDPKLRPNGKKNVILTSNYVVECYKENYRAQWGNRDKEASNNAKLDMFNMELVGINAFGSSQRMIFAPEGNILKLFGKIGTPDRLETQIDKRDVNLLGDWWIGYGFATADLLFVNDQA